MKLELKSNYESFSKRLDNLARYLYNDTQNAMIKLAEEMCDEMKSEIALNRDIWYEPLRDMEGLGDDITYEVVDNSVVLVVGRNTQSKEMGDGRLVNPYMFIQFGWGISGEKHPVQYAYQNLWEYNVKGHQKAWVYATVGDKKYWTVGRKGINFFYSVIKKYRTKWKDIVAQEIKKRYE